jgi:hypothetical protein
VAVITQCGTQKGELKFCFKHTPYAPIIAVVINMFRWPDIQTGENSRGRPQIIINMTTAILNVINPTTLLIDL